MIKRIHYETRRNTGYPFFFNPLKFRRYTIKNRLVELPVQPDSYILTALLAS